MPFEGVPSMPQPERNERAARELEAGDRVFVAGKSAPAVIESIDRQPSGQIEIVFAGGEKILIDSFEDKLEVPADAG